MKTVIKNLYAVMQNILAVLCFLMLTVCFSSCSHKEESGSVIGAWKLVDGGHFEFIKLK